MATVTVLDKMVAIRAAIIKMHKISLEIKIKKNEHDKLQEEVVKALGVNGLLEFNNYRCKIVQSLRRNVPWKELTYGLAKKLFPKRDEYIKWLKSVARKYKKAPISPFAKITYTEKEEV